MLHAVAVLLGFGISNLGSAEPLELDIPSGTGFEAAAVNTCRKRQLPAPVLAVQLRPHVRLQCARLSRMSNLGSAEPRLDILVRDSKPQLPIGDTCRKRPSNLRLPMPPARWYLTCLRVVFVKHSQLPVKFASPVSPLLLEELRLDFW